MQHYIEGRSLRHADGRAFWVSLRQLQECVYVYWNFWPNAVYPPVMPVPCMEGYEWLRIVHNLNMPSHRSLASLLPQSQMIPRIPWCRDNWVQLEIATRNLALNIDTMFDNYHPHGCRALIKPCAAFDDSICIIKSMDLLRDNVVQLHWWLIALSLLT